MTKSYDHHDAKFWLNFVSLCSVLALSEVARGIVNPVLPLYVTSLNGSPFMLSVVVAAFSIGRLIASMVYGVLSDRMSIRWILCSALVITIAGHALYIVAEYIPTANNAALIVLIIGRAFGGSGTSILSAARAFTAKQTLSHERTFFFSTLGIVQFVGFAGTPVLGGIYVHINMGGGWIIDTYTFGTYLVMFLDAILLVIIWFGLKEDPPAGSSSSTVNTVSSTGQQISDSEVSRQQLLPDSSNASEFFSINIDDTLQTECRSRSASLPIISALSATPVRQRRFSAPAAVHYDDIVSSVPETVPVKQYSMVAAVLMVVLNGSSRGCLAIAETYGADLYYIVQFGKDYTRDQVSTMNEALFYTGLGAVGVIVFLLMHRLTNFFGEATLLISGFVFLSVGFFSLVDPNLGLGTLIFGMALLYALATPVNNTLCASMLSKECSPESAGLMMGWLTAAGSLGRIVFPLASGALYALAGISAAMLFPGVMAVLSALSIVLGLKTYKTWGNSFRNIEYKLKTLVYRRELVAGYDDEVNGDSDDDNDDWLQAEDLHRIQQRKRRSERRLWPSNVNSSDLDSEMSQLQQNKHSQT